ncbi:MAG: hypothetical protein CM1200mP41_39230 [Gammaproteobacteria bacterium]|nr:MAG: hypothetical protein CM1200mP41_39230 [Gammaproteobacteria bacterium]
MIADVARPIPGAVRLGKKSGRSFISRSPWEPGSGLDRFGVRSTGTKCVDHFRLPCPHVTAAACLEDGQVVQFLGSKSRSFVQLG